MKSPRPLLEDAELDPGARRLLRSARVPPGPSSAELTLIAHGVKARTAGAGAATTAGVSGVKIAGGALLAVTAVGALVLASRAEDPAPRTARAPVASVPPADRAPVASVPQADRAPVASVPPAGRAPVASVPPAGRAPVASVPPADRAPVASVPPAGRAPVASASVPQAGRAPVASASVPQAGRAPVASVSVPQAGRAPRGAATSASAPRAPRCVAEGRCEAGLEPRLAALAEGLAADQRAVAEAAPRPAPRRSPPSAVDRFLRGRSGLDAEIALVDAARRRLGDRPAAALSVLRAHRRRFPEGALADERDALEVRVHLALGAVARARASLARLSARAPDSPHIAPLEARVAAAAAR